MTGLASNLRHARAAIAYVKHQLPRGAGNRSDSPPDGRACVQSVRDSMVSTTYWIPHLAQRAIQVGCGNCGEQAAVAYVFLQQRGVLPLDYMNLYDPQGGAVHSFVVIEFAGADDSSSGWGESAVICDPWDDEQAYAASQIRSNMALWESGSSVRSLFRADALSSRSD